MSLRTFFGFFLSAYIFGRIHLALLHASAFSANKDLPWATLLLWAMVAFPLGILIHEAGHYAAGVALGWRLDRFAIGPFHMGRVAGRWRLLSSKTESLGLVSLVPSRHDHFRIERAIVVGAGPFASLLTGLLFLQLSEHARSADEFWLWTFSTRWALLGVMQLVPFAVGRVTSDGYKIWELIRGGPAADALQAGFLHKSSQLSGLRTREWPRDVILRLVEGQAACHFKMTARRYYAYLTYVHFIDAGEIDQAGRYLDQYMARWSPQDSPEYALEAAWFRAFHKGNREGARNWLAMETRTSEPWVRLRAQAAVAYASQDEEKALKLVDAALGLLAAAPACGARQYEMDRLDELRSICCRQVMTVEKPG